MGGSAFPYLQEDIFSLEIGCTQRYLSCLAWSRASVFNDALCLSDYCLVPVVGDEMGFCSCLFVE